MPDAVRVAEQLQRRFPDNPDYRLDLAHLYSNPVIESFDRAGDQHAAVLAHATTASPEDLRARYGATLGLADLRRAQWRLDDAVSLLTPVIDTSTSTPDWVMPVFLLRRANNRMLLNDSGRGGRCATGGEQQADEHVPRSGAATAHRDPRAAPRTKARSTPS